MYENILKVQYIQFKMVQNLKYWSNVVQALKSYLIELCLVAIRIHYFKVSTFFYQEHVLGVYSVFLFLFFSI